MASDQELRAKLKELEEWFKTHEDNHPSWIDNRKTYQELCNELLNSNTEDHAGTSN
jgi:hypothetical protein